MGNWESVGEAIVETDREDHEPPPAIGIVLAMMGGAFSWSVIALVAWFFT